MLRWGWGKKTPASTPERAEPLAEASAAGDEWAFLRSQPDHDADEMSAVHGAEETPLFSAEAFPPEPQLVAAGVDEALEDDEPSWPPARMEPKPWAPRARRSEGVLAQAVGPVIPAEMALPLEIEYCGELFAHSVEGKALIGRADEDLGLYPELDFSEDDAISRLHARLYALGGCWAVQDLNSLNGSRCNGQVLDPERPVLLRPGDVVEVGDGVRIRVLEIPGLELPPAPQPVGEAEPAEDPSLQLTEEDRALQALLAEAGGPVFVPMTARETPHGRPGPAPEVVDLLDLALNRAEAAGWISPEEAGKADAPRNQFASDTRE